MSTESFESELEPAVQARVKFAVASHELEEQTHAELPPIFQLQGLTLYYDTRRVLDNISMEIPRQAVTAFIGPSGCGKSSLLRCLNRMNDFVPKTHITGRVLFQNQDIYGPLINTIRLRHYIGMVFQRSNPFPQSIFDNVAFGLRMHREATGSELVSRVEQCLQRVGLWNEVKDRLKQNALSLSGGQQQRLCIARAISINPQVLLMDEPASSLDPVATAKIEELILDLRNTYSIVIVTHNLQQAGRISDKTAFFYDGRLMEYDRTENLFSNPQVPATEAFINGRFG